jgi:hypothetical protein
MCPQEFIGPPQPGAAPPHRHRRAAVQGLEDRALDALDQVFVAECTKAFEAGYGEWIAAQNARVEAHGIPGADLRPW